MEKFSFEPVGFFARHLNLIDRQELYIYGFNTSEYHGIIKGILSTKKKVANFFLLGIGRTLSFLLLKLTATVSLSLSNFDVILRLKVFLAEHLQSHCFHQIGIW